jgi:O-antigen/teichoic acid export membrane protein
VLSLALLGTNALAYVSTVVAARVLAPEAFGELSALLGLLLVGVVPAVGLQAAAALALGGRRVGTGPTVAAVHAAALAAAVLVGLAALALAGPLAAVVHATDPAALVWLAVLLVPHTVAGGYDGILQGTGRPGALAAALAAVGVAKVAGGLGGLLAVGTPTAVLAGMALGASGGAVVGWLLCGRPGVGPGAGRVARRAGAAAGALLGFVLLANLDLLLARHHLPPGEAGRYAVGSIVFKVAFWLPQGVTLVLVPRLADAAAGRRALARATALVGACGLVLVLGAVVAAPLLPLLLGRPAPAALWAFALLGALLAVLQQLLYAGIAARDRAATVLVWVAAAVETAVVGGLAAAGAATPGSVVAAAVAVAALAVAAGGLLLRAAR